MTLQDWANLATILGVPLTIIGLIIAYWALKGQINTIKTQINTNIDKITLQLNHMKEQNVQITYIVAGNVKAPTQIAQTFKESFDEVQEDE